MKIKTLAASILALFVSNVVAQPPGTQGGFDTYSFEVDPYNGQTIRLVAEAASCEGSPVGFIVDNVRLTAGGTVSNGSFESGLDDWSAIPEGCDIYTAQAGQPIGFEGSNTAPAPSNGTFLAASSAESPGLCRLQQDITLTVPFGALLQADMGWTFSQFSEDNDGCEVSIRIESAGGAVLASATVFKPTKPAPQQIPTTPIWSLLTMSALLTLLGARRLRKKKRG